MNHSLAHLLLALAAAELVHGLSEVLSARMKVARLSAYIDRRPWTEMRVHVDTQAKAYAVGLTVLTVLTAIFFAIFTAIDAVGNTLLVIAAVLVLATYLIEFFGFDRFHSEIGAVTRPFRLRSEAERGSGDQAGA